MKPHINLVTFGIKHHSTQTTMPFGDRYFNCQVLNDPGSTDLYSHNGTEEVVKRFLRAHLSKDAVAINFWKTLLQETLVACDEADKNGFAKTFALYCYGGRHRSVGVSELLRDTLQDMNYRVRVEHRDIHRSSTGFTYGTTKVRKSGKHKGHHKQNGAQKEIPGTVEPEPIGEVI